MSDRSASIAKITRPLLTGNYPRKRLFRRIDRTRKRPLLWISGPAGSGKTTLASSYVGDRRTPCLWYRLDEGDADPATFFHYLGLAARTAAPRSKKTLPLFSPDQRSALPAFAQRYFERLWAVLESGTTVVFDDFQRVPAGSDFHATIRDGLSLLTPGIRVVLISRGPPPPPLARFRAGRSMEVIGWKELRLSPEETGGIARLRRKGKLGRARVLDLQRAADGWAAGLVLLLEKSGPVPAGTRKLAREKPQEIFDYFAGEILENLDEKMQVFLLKSAFLPRMTARIAARVTGERKAGQVLSYLNSHNYFTEVHPDPEPVYEFHPLFREFLISRGGDVFSAKYLRRLKVHAAAALEESGREEEAAGLLRELGDFEGLARVLRKHAPLLVRHGRTGTLAEWLDAFPEKVREEDPWLLYWSGVSRLVVRPGESRRDFEEAFRRFRRTKETEGIFLSWAGAVDAVIYGGESLKSLDAWFSALDGLMTTRKRFPSEEIGSQVTCAMIKALALRRPPFPDREKWAGRALEVSRSSRDTSTRFTALLNLAYYRFHGGDLPATGLLLEPLRAMAGKPELSPLSRLALHWLEAAFANMQGEHARCREAVEDGILLSDSAGIPLMDFLLMGHGALCSLHTGDMGTARGFLRKMASRLPEARPWEAAFYHQLAAWEALYRADQAQAVFHSGRSLAHSEAVGNPWSEALARLQGAFVSHRGGDGVEAAAQLERARRMGEESGMRFIRFACLLAGSYFSLLEGDEESGLESLKEGLGIGKEKGYADTYLWCPGLLEKVCAKAMERGIETEYVRGLIRRNALLPDGSVPVGDRWPWPRKVYTLGGFRLLREERPARLSRKVQHKPLQMLKALVALGGRDVPGERVTDILWPDADGDLAHQSFATTLRRLRKLIGEEKAVLLRDGRLTLDGRHCWVDAFAFESLVDRIDAASRGGGGGADGRGIVDLANTAVDLYKGPFLAGETAHPWVMTLRERLRSKFLRAVGVLGLHLEEEGRWAEAASIYRKGLEVDELAEGFYQRLMSCHHRMGQVAEALAVYDRCRKTLSGMLGISPSAETEAIAGRIRPA